MKDNQNYVVRHLMHFDSWVHLPADMQSNVIPMAAESLHAKFKAVAFDVDDKKVKVVNLYHPLESLLEFEECATCSVNIRRPDHLRHLVNALNAYNGPKDKTPLLHRTPNSVDNGYYPRGNPTVTAEME